MVYDKHGSYNMLSKDKKNNIKYEHNNNLKGGISSNFLDNIYIFLARGYNIYLNNVLGIKLTIPNCHSQK